VFAGGESPLPSDRDVLEGDIVIAADGGLETAAALGIAVDHVVGDMDSVTTATLEEAVAAGASAHRHPADKDATDLELALLAAVAAGATDIVVVGGYGGRLDHLLGNALLLAAAELDRSRITWYVGDTSVFVARPGTAVVVSGEAGELVSLLPVAGVAGDIRTSGLRWALDGENLAPGSTRGVSNELTGPTARVELETGVLLVVHERSAPS
jgi:thiamine pyrophosphokinase